MLPGYHGYINSFYFVSAKCMVDVRVGRFLPEAVKTSGKNRFKPVKTKGFLPPISAKTGKNLHRQKLMDKMPFHSLNSPNFYINGVNFYLKLYNYL